MSEWTRPAPGLFRHRVRYFWRQRRWVALLRACWLTIKRDGGEDCQLCGRRMPLIWHAPDPLWMELHGRRDGLICPRCFTILADKSGIRLSWTPVVTRRDGVPTTNWWHDPVRDALLMGEPDPGFMVGDLVRVPQPTWARVAEAYPVDVPSPYPAENRV